MRAARQQTLEVGALLHSHFTDFLLALECELRKVKQLEEGDREILRAMFAMMPA